MNRHLAFKATIWSILGLTLAIGTPVLAGNVNWKAAVDGNWNDGANWDTEIVPGNGDDVFIDLSGDYTVTLDVDADVQSLTLGGASGNQTLSASSRTITLNNAIALQLLPDVHCQLSQAEAATSPRRCLSR